MQSFNVAFLGAGRMGMTHLRNLVGIDGVQVRVVADTLADNAQRGAAVARAQRSTSNIEAAVTADDVDVVMICTPTNTHAQLIELAVQSGKAVWCEKPVAPTLEATRRVLASVEVARQPVMIGFMRRFDPGYAAAKQAIDAGEVGTIERFRSLTCDHHLPPVSYIATSGGIFVDMLVHDIDLARFLVGEIAEVTAIGSVMIDKGYGEVGDVDTAMALLRFESGALGILEASRRTTWAYDIRTEIAGSQAKLVIEGAQKTPLISSANLSSRVDHYEGFPERFDAAYRNEMHYFFECLRQGSLPSPDVKDALETLRVSLAATLSLKEGRPVKVSEIT